MPKSFLLRYTKRGIYSFVWDSINGQAGQNATNLTPGIHYVYVTDAKGCTAMDSVNISEPTQLTIAIP